MEGKNSVCGFLGGPVHLGASAPVMRVPFPRGDDLPRPLAWDWHGPLFMISLSPYAVRV